jgi:endonuclease I
VATKPTTKMMKLGLLSATLLAFVGAVCTAPVPGKGRASRGLKANGKGSPGNKGNDYYDGIDLTATDDALKEQLFYLINPHIVLDYDAVWTAFETVDLYLNTYPCDSDPSHIPDVYSAYCWSPEKVDQGGECGNYKKEGDCFNREHVWPKSWFGGFDYGMNAQTDLFELWPSDGYVNGLRGNYPLGRVSTATYTSTSGCKVGTCNVTGYTGNCFEVHDDYKGDFARSYFYLSTAYWNMWDCCDDVGVNGSSIKPWMEDELRYWHKIDPVSDIEVSRNEEIYSEYQQNRNPFIDYPELVDQISDF